MIRRHKLFTNVVGCYMALPLEKKLVRANGFGGKASGDFSLGGVRESALAGRSSSAGPHRVAAHWGVEARSDFEMEGDERLETILG